MDTFKGRASEGVVLFPLHLDQSVSNAEVDEALADTQDAWDRSRARNHLLEPTSFLFREGHRIRIAMAGHDGAALRRVPASGTPTLRVQRNDAHLSWIDLPVVPPWSQ